MSSQQGRVMVRRSASGKKAPEPSGSRKNSNKQKKQPPHQRCAVEQLEADLTKEPAFHQLVLNLEQEGVLVGEHLGTGSYSLVVKAMVTRQNVPPYPVAIKIIHTKKKNDYVERFLPREMRVVKELSHRNIIAFHAVQDLRGGSEKEPGMPFVIFTTEWCAGGDLLRKIKNLQLKGARGMTEKDMKITFRQLTEAMDYLDKKQIVHRDLKCENIMLDHWENVKLGDFGFARHISLEEKSNTFCGSRAYVAPEIAKSRSYFGRPADIWSVGIIMYVSWSGHFPFDDRHPEEMVAAQLQHRIKFSSRMPISTGLKQAISDMLHPIPQRRPSYEQLLRGYEWLASQPSGMRKTVPKSSSSGELLLLPASRQQAG